MGFALGGSFVSQSGGLVTTPIVLTFGFFITWAVCLGSLVILVVSVGWIWAGGLHKKFSRDCFRQVRMGLTIFAAVCATYCAVRLIFNVAIPEKLDKAFVPELIGYSIFWVLAPPIWFFVEYFAVKSDCIIGYGTDADLKDIKDYADYASKIWAGVLAMLVALIALKQQP